MKLARDHYLKQFALVKEMAAADPADAQLISNTAVALIKVGDVDAAMGRKTNAAAHYREALKIREQLSAAVPSDVFLRRDLEEARTKMDSVDKGVQRW